MQLSLEIEGFCPDTLVAHGGLLLPASYNLAEHCFPGRSVRAILLKASLSYTCLSLGGNYFSIAARRLLSMPPDDAGLPLPERAGDPAEL